jgi:hypothetical protein
LLCRDDFLLNSNHFPAFHVSLRKQSAKENTAALQQSVVSKLAILTVCSLRFKGEIERNASMEKISGVVLVFYFLLDDQFAENSPMFTEKYMTNAMYYIHILLIINPKLFPFHDSKLDSLAKVCQNAVLWI